jgi:transcriptional regulator with XRE-family HTH domain
MASKPKDGVFKDRLNQACDDSKVVPAYGKGRQVVIAKRLKVTQEAVRKWFAGEAMPKPGKMSELAEYLEVDEAWLALGITPEMGRDEKKKASRTSSGAVYIVTGMVMLDGGSVAWPGETDPRAEYVDIYAIMHGTQTALHVCNGREMPGGKFELIVPRQYRDVRCVGFIYAGGGRCHILDLQTTLIERRKQRKAGEYAITLDRAGSNYKCGTDDVPRLKSFTDLK